MEKTLLFIIFLSVTAQAMDHENPINKHKRSRSHDITIHFDDHTKKDEESQSCNTAGSHSNLKLAIVSALAGLATSAITAGVSLAVHFTQCKTNTTLPS